MTANNDLANFSSKNWRMNNLYRIVDKSGDSIPFKLNPVQQNVLENIHKRNLILKARQLGMSTFAVLYLLDEVIFKPNTSAGIVSYSLEHAQHIYKRIIGHALDNFMPFVSLMAGVQQRSAREVSFANGSFLRVDTSLRGGAYKIVLVSEFGKTCARNPVKAEEVVTGTLQTVPIEGTLIIESTGEGNEGFYADMVNQASQRGNDNLADLEYKLFFFNWLTDPSYTMAKTLSFDIELIDYFHRLEKTLGCALSEGQRNWYAFQKSILGEKVKQEFPSTITEAFISSSDAYYFQAAIEKAYQDHRCLDTQLYDALCPVYVAMDIGVNDLTVIIFFQFVHGEIRIIDYYEDNGKGVDFYAQYMQGRPYMYNTVFLPHDAARRDGIVVENTYERDFRRLFAHTSTKFVVLKRTDKNLNISNCKLKLDRTVFALKKVKNLLDAVSKYRKKWSEQFGKYLDEPFHDINSNYADALIYAMQAISHIEIMCDSKAALSKHKETTESRYKKF